MAEAGEVDGAGGVKCFLRGADGEPGDEDGVLVAVVGGGVDREAEGVRGAAVTQPAERDGLAAAQDPSDVGERPPVSDLHFFQLGPVLFRVVQQP